MHSELNSIWIQDPTQYLSGNGFKAKASTAISAALRKRFPTRPIHKQDTVGNRLRYVKGTFEEYEFVRDKSGVGWDDGEKKASAETDFIAKFTEEWGDRYAKCFKKPCPYYNRLAQLFGGNKATGDHILHLANSEAKKSKAPSTSSAPSTAAASLSSPSKRKASRRPLETLQNDIHDGDLDATSP
ncbi:hypothetical protein B0H11DRAFT_2255143 [Mycena galericulata]|nr:hypothetical protein B0H11DRAFT_2255143 [Mycena galericulata]